MHIHFVCRGNAYRSRLAEAYLRSQRLPDLRVSSSGIEAATHMHTINGPISWVAQRILQHNGLVPFMSMQPTQTTPALLQAADLVVFMEEAHLHFAREHYSYADNRFQIWHVPDIDPTAIAAAHGDRDAAIILVSEATYRNIKERVAVLIVSLTDASSMTSLG